jgi:cysteine sulfinate desulfinase/cysteine desulfurase-like protein
MAIDLQVIAADFIVASAHKFHGPKGVGLLLLEKIVDYNRYFMVENRKRTQSRYRGLAPNCWYGKGSSYFL